MADLSQPRALTVAGSDSGGGAGIQADLKTFQALGAYGMSALTALTAQNTRGVWAIHAVPADFVARQIDAVLEDIGADAAKTGMLFDSEIIQTVASRLRHHGLRRLVVDPVMVSTSGSMLLAPEAVQALCQTLFPLATVVTPNLHEVQALCGMTIQTRDDMPEAARRLMDMGCPSVLIKGGHAESTDESLDYWTDGPSQLWLRGLKSHHPNTHGSGCVLSAAIAAYLARGLETQEALMRAKTYITGAIAHALPVGSGYGPVNPAWRLTPDRTDSGQ